MRSGFGEFLERNFGSPCRGAGLASDQFPDLPLLMSLIDGVAVTSSYVSEHEFHATVPRSKLLEPGTLRVAVSRAKPRSVKSAEKELKIV